MYIQLASDNYSSHSGNEVQKMVQYQETVIALISDMDPSDVWKLESDCLGLATLSLGKEYWDVYFKSSPVPRPHVMFLRHVQVIVFSVCFWFFTNCTYNKKVVHQYRVQ